MRLFRFGFGPALLVLFSLICQLASGQGYPTFEQGTRRLGAYNASNIDNISLLNGNTNLFIPLVSYPQRGSHPPLEFGLLYHNRGFYADWSCRTIGPAGFFGALAPPTGLL